MTHRITYIWHDCFIIESDLCYFVFDYWKDPNGEIFNYISDTKPIYIFVSHHHKDHFNADIFRWPSRYNISPIYIVSYDTARFIRHLLNPSSTYRRPTHFDPSMVHILSPGQNYVDLTIRVEALGSTDIGCSYLITSADTHIFHAGDLNIWLFEDNKSVDATRQAFDAFTFELQSLSNISDHIDIAMFPIDFRLGKNYTLGIKTLMQKIDILHLLPMHFAYDDSPHIIEQNINAASLSVGYLRDISDTKIHLLTDQYQSISLEI